MCIFSANEMYEVAGNRWIGRPNAQPRHGIGAAVVGQRIYVPGGGTQPDRDDYGQRGVRAEADGLGPVLIAPAAPLLLARRARRRPALPIAAPTAAPGCSRIRRPGSSDLLQLAARWRQRRGRPRECGARCAVWSTGDPTIDRLFATGPSK
jgi:hypothetical protein